MTNEHDRYAQLAVGHVLGGLDAPDAAEFRSHLLSCRGCRARVAELRGIAADLAAAERDERSRLRVRTVTREQPTRQPVEGVEFRITVRQVTIMVVVVMIVATMLAFWNLHLRTVGAGYATALDAQNEVLRGLATGIPVQVEFGDDVTGMVTTDGEEMWVSLAGIEPLADRERLVAWLLTSGEAEPRPQVLRVGSVDETDAPDRDGRTLAVGLDTGGADELIITREPPRSLQGPGGERVLTARLRASADR